MARPGKTRDARDRAPGKESDVPPARPLETSTSTRELLEDSYALLYRLRRVSLEYEGWYHYMAHSVGPMAGAAPLHEDAADVEALLPRKPLPRTPLAARDDERRRIAADLHDGMGQLLSAFGVTLRLLGADLQDEASRKHLDRLATIRLGLERELDKTLVRLHCPPMADGGFAAALRHHVARWSSLHGIATDLLVDDSLDALGPEAAHELFQVVQEALTNVAKHAGATHVELTLARQGQRLRLCIEDDGRGLQKRLEHLNPVEHLGLATMRQRIEAMGGRFSIQSEPGGGVCINATVPLPRRRGRRAAAEAAAQPTSPARTPV
jgi:signal transduction histidine kinase